MHTRTNPETARTEAVSVTRSTFDQLDDLVVDVIRRLAISPSPELQKKSVDLQAALGEMRCEIVRFDLAVELWGPAAKRPEVEAKRAETTLPAAVPLHLLQRAGEVVEEAAP